ncbi:MAG TPA: DMT family transporter [Methylomirabilota bacterium]|nr:DMT family transporter [Methylomirabilota bacterium]
MDLGTLGALCALGSAVAWAVTSLLVRSLTPRYGTLTINAARTTLCAVLIALWVAAAGSFHALSAVSARSLVLLLVSIVTAIAIGDTVFFESTRMLGLGRAMTVAMSYPVVAAVLAALVLDERITAKIAVGGAVTLAGLGLVVAARQEEGAAPRSWRGLAAASAAALAWAVSVVALRVPLAEMDALTAQLVRLPLAAALLWAMPWSWRDGPALVRGGGGVALRLGVLSVVTALSSVMYVLAVKHAGVAIATVLSSTAPLFAVPLGVVFLGERLPPIAVVGAAVTVAGVVVLKL